MSRPGDSPATDHLLFAESLGRLFVAAGSPSLKSVADTVARHGRHSGTPVPRGLYARIGEWRSGKHLPREFDSVVQLVIADLLRRASAFEHTETAFPTRLTEWRAIWRKTAESNDRAAVRTGSRAPYPGLEPFTIETSELFFGRDIAIGEVLARIDRALLDGGGLVTVAGMSGAGKSSLLAAGVLPALSARADTRVATVSLRENPIDNLLCALDLDSTVTAAELPTALNTRSEHGDAESLVIVMDQSEELLTEADPTTIERFVELLTIVVSLRTDSRSRAVVILGLRSDFIPQWGNYPLVRDAMNNSGYILGPMSRPELTSAIEGPLCATGRTIDPTLAEQIIEDLCGPYGAQYEAGLLPLLGHALEGTWQRSNGSRLTLADYRATGGVIGALTETAESLWSRLSPDEQAAGRRVLVRLIHYGDGIRDTRRTQSRSEVLAGLGEQGAHALDALLDSRLVTMDGDGGIHLVHEILLTAWPRLNRWMDEDREILRARQELDRAAREWAIADRDPGLLLSERRLDLAQNRGFVADSVTLTRLSADFVAASVRASRRRALVRRTALLTLVAVTVVAVASTLFARQALDTAQRAQATALREQVAERALTWQDRDITLSAQLTLLAYRLDPSPENKARLLSTEGFPLATVTRITAGAVYGLSSSPDHRFIAAATEDRTIRILPLSELQQQRPQMEVLTGHLGFVTSVSWSPDSTRLASTSDDGTIKLWTRGDSGWYTTNTLRGHTGRVVSAEFSPDGARLVSGGMDSTVRVWDAHDGHQIAVLSDHTADIRSVAWAPDGRTIASGSGDGTARIWDATSYLSVATLKGHSSRVHSVAYSPDSRMLVTGSDDSTARLWDVTNPSTAHGIGDGALTEHSAPIWSAVFSPDGRRVLIASTDGKASLWNITDPATPTELGRVLAGAESELFTAEFAADGRSVATSGADGTIRTWQLPTTVLAAHARAVTAPAIAGTSMLSTDASGGLALWDLADLRAPALLGTTRDPDNARAVQVVRSPDGRLAATSTTAHRVQIYRVDRAAPTPISSIPNGATEQTHIAMSPDGSEIVVPETDQSYRVWDIKDPLRPMPRGQLIHHAGPGWSTAVTYSPDGNRLLTAGQDNRLRLWDITDSDSPRPVADDEIDGGTVNALAWSPRGLIAAGGANGAVRLWQVDEKNTLERRKPSELGGHTVRSLTFTTSGERLAASGDSSVIALSDASDNDDQNTKGLQIPLINSSRWYSTVNGDGSLLAAGGDNGQLQLIVTDISFAAQRICSYAGNLTEERWSSLVPNGIPYRQICT